MQEVFSIVLVGVATALLCVLLRALRPEMALFAGVAGAIIVTALALPLIGGILQGLGKIGTPGELQGVVGQCVRAAGIVLLCEFAAAVCKDAGQAALAGQIEFFGRTALCAMCVPVVAELFSLLDSFSFSS
ncbi:MAG: SpoIIIAC/SpoIIIAD family protein [Eubacteriales bacterium]|nr:SpoIIIAC/SpoIIIAD family protein [Eubacteriales bacterium]